MNNRQKELLSTIVKEHISTAKPVGSTLLVDKYHFHISPATVRNDMMELEEQGYITQPHTSAGRVPTESGYKYYVENFLSYKDITAREKKALEESKVGSIDATTKKIAKTLAEITHEAIIVGFTKEDVYYTGISYLLQKPEFAQLDTLYGISEIVDQLDEVINTIFSKIHEETQVFIGKDNPISKNCSMIATHIQSNNENESILCIIGPMRMDYERHVPRLNYAKEQINNL